MALKGPGCVEELRKICDEILQPTYATHTHLGKAHLHSNGLTAPLAGYVFAAFWKPHRRKRSTPLPCAVIFWEAHLKPHSRQ